MGDIRGLRATFNHNRDSPLPLTLANTGRPARLAIRIADPVHTFAERVDSLRLRAVLFRRPDRWDVEFKEGDAFEARLNGVRLPSLLRDPAWKDPQIFSPKPQRISGGSGIFEVDPEQKLLRLEWKVDPRLCRQGENHVEIRISQRAPIPPWRGDRSREAGNPPALHGLIPTSGKIQ